MLVNQIIIEKNLKPLIKDLVGSFNFINNFLIVSDQNTYEILGNEVKNTLGKKAVNITLPHNVKPDIKIVEQIKEAGKNCDAIIAIGSGTINDVCKYASFLDKKPYLIFPTAPSMNGYSSANASIIINGHKKTLKAHLPEAIFVDLEIMAKAPKRLIQSGLGDSLCRPTAQSDWLLSHYLLNTDYDNKPFEMLEKYEENLFKSSEALIKGDLDSIELLVRTLLTSGEGMAISGGSYPASQGEHMLAHTLEMVHPQKMSKFFHGEHIAVTTITMAEIQEKSLKNNNITISKNLDENEIKQYFGKEIAASCIDEYKQKLNKINQITDIDKKFNKAKEHIAKIAIPAEKLRKILKKADICFDFSALSLNKTEYENAIKYAKFSRDRFTFLDIFN